MTTMTAKDVCAVAVCRGCPELQPCLEFAVAAGIDEGVWGGTTGRERELIRRRRRAA